MSDITIQLPDVKITLGYISDSYELKIGYFDNMHLSNSYNTSWSERQIPPNFWAKFQIIIICIGKWIHTNINVLIYSYKWR